MEISVQGLDVALRNATGGWTMVKLDGLYPVDFRAVDIFDEVRWDDFYNDYRRSTSQLLQSITLSIKALALSLSDGVTGPLALTLDPTDDLSYIDEVGKGLQTLLADDGWWATKESGSSFDLLSDPMGESFVSYLEQNSDVIFDPNRTVDDALGPLALKLFQGIELSFPEINGSYRSVNLDIIRQYIGSQGGSGLFESMMAGYYREICSIFEDYRTWLVGTNSLGKGLITTALEHLAKGSIEAIPGVRDWIESRMFDLTKEVDRRPGCPRRRPVCNWMEWVHSCW